jgi:hypothetical protein
MRAFLFSWLLFTITYSHAEISFLTIADIHFGINNTSGDGKDTDSILFKEALNKLTTLSKNVDFILALGDLPTHSFWKTPEKETSLETVFHGLYQADTTAIPMFFIAGNNDSLNGNYQPFSSPAKSPLTLAHDWQGACVYCEALLIDGSHMEDKGYYSSYVIPGNKDIILIALNSIPFSKTPFFLPKYPNQDKDAIAELQWLEQELQTHSAKQLLIAMHIPPGHHYNGKPIWYDLYLNQFINILDHAFPRYGQISLLTAHTHMDDIRKIELQNGPPIYAYSTPSISRIHRNNPGIKIFTLNSNHKIKDYTTYYTLKDAQWGQAHYQAMKDIFNDCLSPTLSHCLNELEGKAVCLKLNQGRFYGVKSPRVDCSVCELTYPIN